MVFTKSFPKKSDKSVYPQWEEISLLPEEEFAVEKGCRVENKRMLR